MIDAEPTPWSESTLQFIFPNQVWAAVKEVGPMIARATDRSNGRWDLGSVVDLLERGDMQLWISRRDGVAEGCCVSQIVRYPRKKVCALPFVGGSLMRNWLRFERDISEWARAQGCTELVGYDCRGGAWLRVLKGWLKGHIEITRPL